MTLVSCRVENSELKASPATQDLIRINRRRACS